MAIRTEITNPSRIKKSKKNSLNRNFIERRAIFALLLMAWAWILGFLGVVMYHLKTQKTIESNNNNDNNHNNIHPAPAPPNAKGASSSLSNNNNNNNVNTMTVPVIEPKSVPRSDDGNNYDSPLVIFTCKRANYLSETLTDIYNNIFKQPCRFGCPIIISQDGTNHPDVDQVVAEFQIKFELIGIPLYHLHHIQSLQSSQEASNNNHHHHNRLRGISSSSSSSHTDAYKALAQHYGWALTQIFHGRIDSSSRLPIPKRIIILEEDIHTAPDFFSYMEAASKLLDQDNNNANNNHHGNTLFAVSAFNDNGHLVQDSKRLLRSDFFPGLGWMMTRQLWIDELESKWPTAYWDDWLREPAQRQNRQILRPEYSRTYHFGRQGGASNNQFGTILDRIELVQNDNAIDWSKEDLSYVSSESNFDDYYGTLVFNSIKVTSLQDAMSILMEEDETNNNNVRLEYHNLKQFQQLANLIGIMDDEKATIPRTAYKGIVEVRPTKGNLLFLTPTAKEMQKNFPSFVWN